jgi:hypothetical protein
MAERTRMAHTHDVPVPGADGESRRTEGEDLAERAAANAAGRTPRPGDWCRGFHPTWGLGDGGSCRP